jgi:hypothetical protein
MDTTMTAIKAIEHIKEVAKTNSNRDASLKTRQVTSSINCFRQGDLYFFRMPNNHPCGEQVERKQLAEGESLGARHVLKGNFKIFKGTTAPPQVSELHARIGLGFCFDVCPGDICVHPEHDNYFFETAGRWQVLHQVDLRTLQKVRD